jgi:hypothetical protein
LSGFSPAPINAGHESVQSGQRNSVLRGFFCYCGCIITQYCNAFVQISLLLLLTLRILRPSDTPFEVSGQGYTKPTCHFILGFHPRLNDGGTGGKLFLETGVPLISSFSAVLRRSATASLVTPLVRSSWWQASTRLLATPPRYRQIKCFYLIPFLEGSPLSPLLLCGYHLAFPAISYPSIGSPIS